MSTTYTPVGLHPAWCQNGCTTAQEDRAVIQNLVCGQGVSFANPAGANSLKVTTAGSGLSSSVGSGGGFIQGADVTCQGMYSVTLCTAATVTHPAADPSQNRIDSIVAVLRDNQYVGAVGPDWDIAVITGTPAATPQSPITAGTVGTNISPYASWIPLSDVLITAGLTGPIPAGNYTDQRVPFRACGTAQGVLATTVLSGNGANTSAGGQVGLLTVNLPSKRNLRISVLAEAYAFMSSGSTKGALAITRDGTEIARQNQAITQSPWDTQPYSMDYIDVAVPAGAHTYKVMYILGLTVSGGGYIDNTAGQQFAIEDLGPA